MIEIIPLNQYDIARVKSFDYKNTYITSLDLVSKLLVTKLPIENSKAIKQILNFLKYADMRMEIEDTTLLSINKNTFIEYFSSNTYKKYVDILKELKVMTSIPHKNGEFYEIGKTSQQYRFFNEYCFGELCLVLIEEYSLNIRIVPEVKVHKKFKSAIEETIIDFNKAINAEINYSETNNILRMRLSRLFNLNNKRFIKKGCKTDRIFHSFSNLSKVSRQFQSINGLKYSSIDIVNCQPMLLCYLLKKQNYLFDIDYIKDCESGMLYENFIGIEGDFTYKTSSGNWSARHLILDRGEVKTQMYRSVYFGFDTGNPVNKKFEELYPITYSSIKTIVEKSGNLAAILQNIESNIFDDLIPQDSKYFYTLFDAIYFTSDSDKLALSRRLMDIFKCYDLKPNLRYEN